MFKSGIILLASTLKWTDPFLPRFSLTQEYPAGFRAKKNPKCISPNTSKTNNTIGLACIRFLTSGLVADPVKALLKGQCHGDFYHF